MRCLHGCGSSPTTLSATLIARTSSCVLRSASCVAWIDDVMCMVWFGKLCRVDGRCGVYGLVVSRGWTVWCVWFGSAILKTDSTASALSDAVWVNLTTHKRQFPAADATTAHASSSRSVNESRRFHKPVRSSPVLKCNHQRVVALCFSFVQAD
jgi:hypothetical protein